MFFRGVLDAFESGGAAVPRNSPAFQCRFSGGGAGRTPSLPAAAPAGNSPAFQCRFRSVSWDDSEGRRFSCSGAGRRFSCGGVRRPPPYLPAAEDTPTSPLPGTPRPGRRRRGGGGGIRELEKRAEPREREAV